MEGILLHWLKSRLPRTDYYVSLSDGYMPLWHHRSLALPDPITLDLLSLSMVSSCPGPLHMFFFSAWDAISSFLALLASTPLYTSAQWKASSDFRPMHDLAHSHLCNPVTFHSSPCLPTLICVSLLSISHTCQALSLPRLCTCCSLCLEHTFPLLGGWLVLIL